jgi:hydroxyacylglutathione hydrolase
MEALAARGISSGEGVDRAFVPDTLLADGAEVSNLDGGWTLTARHTPGHFGNHLCFEWKGGIFSGDLAMGWSTSLVAAPDGDMAAYMASLEQLSARQPHTLWPGHGEPVLDAVGRLNWLADHRRGRERQVLEALAMGPATPLTLARTIYTDTPPNLLPAAALNVHSHLLDLLDRNRVTASGFPGFEATFALT